jgi:hypothetical protein
MGGATAASETPAGERGLVTSPAAEFKGRQPQSNLTWKCRDSRGGARSGLRTEAHSFILLCGVTQTTWCGEPWLPGSNPNMGTRLPQVRTTGPGSSKRALLVHRAEQSSVSTALRVSELTHSLRNHASCQSVSLNMFPKCVGLKRIRESGISCLPTFLQ